MKKAGKNSAAGLHCIAIKDISPRECHYLSTSIYVQMAPNLLLPPPRTTVCASRRSQSTGLCMHYIVSQTNLPNPIIKILSYRVANKPWHVSRLREMLQKTLTSTKRRWKDHIAPGLASSHSDVRFEIDFRILMQTFKGHQGPAPGYLADILTPYEPELSYRSSGRALLAAPNSRLRTKGERGFTVRSSKRI